MLAALFKASDRDRTGWEFDMFCGACFYCMAFGVSNRLLTYVVNGNAVQIESLFEYPILIWKHTHGT